MLDYRSRLPVDESPGREEFLDLESLGARIVELAEMATAMHLKMLARKLASIESDLEGNTDVRDN
jgi:hypothetical protein